MTHKAKTTPPAKSKTAKGSKAKAKGSKKPAKPKETIGYVVVRELLTESPLFTEPDRVFATKSAALKFAEECNRELRRLVNPFDDHDPDYLVKGGEQTLLALLKELALPTPKKTRSYGTSSTNWEAWWDGHYFDMTDAQREAIWDALDKYNWYKLKTTTVE